MYNEGVITVDAVVVTRMAAAALNDMCSQLKLGNLAHRFSGEDADEWNVLTLEHVVALKRGRKVAEVFMEGPAYEIIVEDVFQLIRDEHVRDFDPVQYEIYPNRVPDWKGETGPDLVVDWEVPEGLNVAKGPRMPVPKDVRVRPIRVKTTIPRKQ
jgi:hypothetical protein